MDSKNNTADSAADDSELEITSQTAEMQGGGDASQPEEIKKLSLPRHQPPSPYGPVFSIGESDRASIPASMGSYDTGSGGMLMGPGHPAFARPFFPPSSGHDQSFLPESAVPPGARFDPIITPIRPVGGVPTYRPPYPFPSGEPDPDELLPPGMQNPFDPTVMTGGGHFDPLARPPFSQNPFDRNRRGGGSGGMFGSGRGFGGAGPGSGAPFF